MTEREAKKVLEKMLEHIDDMPTSFETALIGEALKIAIIAIENLSKNFS